MRGLCVEARFHKNFHKLPRHADAFHRETGYAIAVETPAPATSVVVLEAHPLMREALLAALTAEPDWHVAALPDNHDVIVPAVCAAPPDLILHSLGNPGIDDLRLLAVLRQTLPNVAILALITSEVPNQDAAALIAGASHVISKAASREELMGTVRALLNTAPSTAPERG